MRDWDRNEEDLIAAGGRLLVLTAEDADITRSALRAREIDVPVAIVEPSSWVRLGRVNATRPELPKPATFVVDPHGAVVWSRGTQAYSDRTSAAKVVRVVRDLVAGAPLIAADEEATGPSGPDEPRITVTAHQGGPHDVTVRVDVSEGWHVYGRRERAAQPLSVRSDGARVRASVPSGERVRWDPDAPASWWLHGTVEVVVHAPITHGELVYQACRASSCLPPAAVGFEVVGEGAPARE